MQRAGVPRTGSGGSSGVESEAAAGWDRRQQWGQEQQRSRELQQPQLQRQRWQRDREHRADEAAAATTAPIPPSAPPPPLPNPLFYFLLFYYLLSEYNGYERQQPFRGISPLPSIIHNSNSNYSRNFNNFNN
jgi:hypothetical protein